MDNENKVEFSEAFLEMAYKAVMFSDAKTDEERQFLQVAATVCERNGISFRKYIHCAAEINAELAKLQQEGGQ